MQLLIASTHAVLDAHVNLESVARCALDAAYWAALVRLINMIGQLH